MSRIYVASSWRNPFQPSMVSTLRKAGHEVYDFRNPAPGNSGFSWSEIDPGWMFWTPERFREALRHPIAQRGFRFDQAGMDGADQCVLVLPCGRSAHLEAGWFMGRDLPVTVYAPTPLEPELMYLLGGADGGICTCTSEVLDRVALLDRLQGDPARREVHL